MQEWEQLEWAFVRMEESSDGDFSTPRMASKNEDSERLWIGNGIDPPLLESNYDEVAESFDGLGLHPDLLRGIRGYGFEKPSAIQQRGIKPILDGHDTIAQAPSGTGKTATFVIAALQLIECSLKECQALIVGPTRELATQTNKVVASLGQHLDFKAHECIGTPLCEQKLREGPQVVVGTPGRVKDMITRGFLKVSHLKLFVVDEAGEMLSGEFKEKIYDRKDTRRFHRIQGY
eukprot:GHVU01097955.1.p1 GENE.GHVU01097955.1~~GHVU01097955.1.p1  ORF type:complete len:233 (+),score=30.13 GHVU01097955.1:429-1127(+)